MRGSRLKCYNCFKKEKLEKATLLSVLAYLVSFCHSFHNHMEKNVYRVLSTYILQILSSSVVKGGLTMV
jgi:hypothetical protein